MQYNMDCTRVYGLYHMYISYPVQSPFPDTSHLIRQPNKARLLVGEHFDEAKEQISDCYISASLLKAANVPRGSRLTITLNCVIDSRLWDVRGIEDRKQESCCVYGVDNL